jgi:hypothetical protein
MDLFHRKPNASHRLLCAMRISIQALYPAAVINIINLVILYKLPYCNTIQMPYYYTYHSQQLHLPSSLTPSKPYSKFNIQAQLNTTKISPRFFKLPSIPYNFSPTSTQPSSLTPSKPYSEYKLQTNVVNAV